MEVIKKIDALLEGFTQAEYSCLNSKSKIKTSDPEKNEYVLDWESGKYSKPSNNTYILLDILNKGKRILSGSGGGYKVKVGSDIYLYDDGNGTTGLPYPYRRVGAPRGLTTKMPGTKAKVLAVGRGLEGLKSFPKGSYTLWVMK